MAIESSVRQWEMFRRGEKCHTETAKSALHLITVAPSLLLKHLDLAKQIEKVLHAKARAP